MAFTLTTEAAGDRIVRRDYASVEAQNELARYRRDQVEATGARQDWANEAFSFTADAWELLKKTNPELHDPDHVRRMRAWRAFAQSSLGKAFRVR